MIKQSVKSCSKIKYLLVGGENLTWKILQDYRAKNDMNGEIYILSRMDRQTKINGYRIELDEILSVMEDYIQAQVYVWVKDNVLYAFTTKVVD